MREIIEAVNDDIREANRSGIAGPAIMLIPLDVDRVVEEWRRVGGGESTPPLGWLVEDDTASHDGSARKPLSGEIEMSTIVAAFITYVRRHHIGFLALFLRARRNVTSRPRASSTATRSRSIRSRRTGSRTARSLR